VFLCIREEVCSRSNEHNAALVAALSKEKIMKATLFILMGLLTAAIFITACGPRSADGVSNTGKTVATAQAGNDLTATLSTADGTFKNGQQEFTLTFTDRAGKTVDVGSAAFNLHMPAMGSMAAMNDNATLTTTSTPGVYKGKVTVEMVGEWQAQVTYEGPAGKGSFMMPITAH
jgi:hypothetical protein